MRNPGGNVFEVVSARTSDEDLFFQFSSSLLCGG
jgi:hypothetical protein